MSPTISPLDDDEEDELLELEELLELLLELELDELELEDVELDELLELEELELEELELEELLELDELELVSSSPPQAVSKASINATGASLRIVGFPLALIFIDR